MSLEMAGDSPIRKRFPELAYCEGADHEDCHFVFMRNNKDYLVVTTRGEQPDGLEIIDIRRTDDTEVVGLYRCQWWNCQVSHGADGK